MLTLTRLKSDDKRLGELLRNGKMSHGEPECYVWFGVEDGPELCGIGSIVIRDGIGYLYSGLVAEKYRGNGIHQDILNARCEYAKDMGCNRVIVSVFKNNTPCKRSLEKAGFYNPNQNKHTAKITGLETWYKDVT